MDAGAGKTVVSTASLLSFGTKNTTQQKLSVLSIKEKEKALKHLSIDEPILQYRKSFAGQNNSAKEQVQAQRKQQWH